MSTEQVQRCDNCLKEYPESKMATHFGYCRRNIKKCPTCHEMYDINFQEEHDEEYHRQEDCPHCKRSFPSGDVKAHEIKCDKKPKYCQYCDLNVPVQTYPAHLKECESRTKPCDKCNRPITNKQYLMHIVSCQGIKEEPKPVARNYQEHMYQQRATFEQPPPSKGDDRSRSRDKARVKPQQQPKTYEYRQEPRILPKEDYRMEEKRYAPIYERNEPKIPSHQQPPRQEVKPEPKRESIKYPSSRQQIKKDEPKKYISSINPPAVKVISNGSSGARREEVRPRGGQNSSNPPMSLEEYNRRFDNKNKEAPKRTSGTNNQPISSKDIYPSRGTNSQKPSSGVNQVRSIDKKYEAPKREEKPSYGVSSSSVNRISSKAPEVKTRVIYETRTVQQSTPQPPQPSQERAAFLHEEFAMGDMGLGSDDPELQMAIMQSMNGSSKNSGSSYNFDNFEPNESFIAQQKVIEQELKKNKHRR